MIIISGGQTGVDRAALDAAIELGMSYGGWFPLGRRAEDGTLPDSYVGMQEIKSRNYLLRTKMNVVDSDATIAITHGVPSGGTWRTVAFATQSDKPYLIIDLDGDIDSQVLAAVSFMRRFPADARINFAGPRESKSPGIHDESKQFILRVLKEYRITSQQSDTPSASTKQ